MIDLMRFFFALAVTINGRRVSAGHFNLWELASVMIVLMVTMAGDIIPARLRPGTKTAQLLDVPAMQLFTDQQDCPDVDPAHHLPLQAVEVTSLQESAE